MDKPNSVVLKEEIGLCLYAYIIQSIRLTTFDTYPGVYVIFRCKGSCVSVHVVN